MGQLIALRHSSARADSGAQRLLRNAARGKPKRLKLNRSMKADDAFRAILADALTAVAALTRRIKVGTCVIVVPLREPVLLAKQAATADLFSNGRFIFGVGVGAYREEFEAVYPDRKGQHRGSIHEEGLEALTRLFRDRRASFEGRYFKFQDVELYPKPRQQPLPMWTSGNTRVAAERAGRWWWETNSASECGLHFRADGKMERSVDVLLREILTA